MRLIDAEQFLVFGYNDIPDANFADGVSYVLGKIDNAPTIDAVEVVRCKNCKYREDRLYCRINPKNPIIVTNVDFCSRGESKNDSN